MDLVEFWVQLGSKTPYITASTVGDSIDPIASAHPPVIGIDLASVVLHCGFDLCVPKPVLSGLERSVDRVHYSRVHMAETIIATPADTRRRQLFVYAQPVKNWIQHAIAEVIHRKRIPAT